MSMGKIVLGPESLREKYNWIVWIIGESRNRVSGANYQLSEALKRMGILMNEELAPNTKIEITDNGSVALSKKDNQPVEIVSDAQRVQEIREKLRRVYGEKDLSKDNNDY
ncbi:hypothetical protein KY385_04085 [Candidatus Parcubacteria bacterium]|nr:hypothetical protein [Candidatus Parcubacteria bacterium]